MPLTVQKLTGNTVEADIRVKLPGGSEEGEPMHLVYRPGVLTPALENEFRIYGQSSEGWAALIARLVASWDLQDGDGKPVPLEYVPATDKKPAGGALLELPGWFLQAVVAGVRENLSPNPRTGETSAGSS